MASAELQAVIDFLRELRATAPAESPDLATRRQMFEMSAPKVQDDVTVVAAEGTPVPADWVAAPGADPARRLLYLHGGAYTLGSRVTHRRLAADISRAAGVVALVIDYRMAPEAPFPAAVDDALAALRWMRANGPDGAGAAAAVFVAGDSAGGGLTLATLLAARDAGDPLPDAAVTLSAWTDLAVTGDIESRLPRDPILSMGRDAVVEAAAVYLGGADPRTPLASPLYADLSGLPPLLIQVGGAEILHDDSVRLAERARAQGVDVTLTVEPDGIHVWQMVAPDAPETKAALTEIGGFLRDHARTAAAATGGD